MFDILEVGIHVVIVTRTVLIRIITVIWLNVSICQHLVDSQLGIFTKRQVAEELKGPL